MDIVDHFSYIIFALSIIYLDYRITNFIKKENEK